MQRARQMSLCVWGTLRTTNVLGVLGEASACFLCSSGVKFMLLLFVCFGFFKDFGKKSQTKSMTCTFFCCCFVWHWGFFC